MFCFISQPILSSERLPRLHQNLGEIVRAKFDFDVAGHYSRPEVLSLTVRDHPSNPVTFALTSGKPEGPYK